MLKIAILAYAKKARSKRAIGEACKEGAGFIWLLGGGRAPHHSTIGRFMHSRLCKTHDHIESEMARALIEMGEAGGETLCQDGIKLESKAGSRTFVWRKSIEKKHSKLRSRAISLLSEMPGRDSGLHPPRGGEAMEGPLRLAVSAAAQAAAETGPVRSGAVHGQGKRKSAAQSGMERDCAFSERQARYHLNILELGGRSSMSKTDRGASFMRMKGGHMMIRQLKPGYSIQLAIDGEYTVETNVHSNATGTAEMMPMFEKMEKWETKYGKSQMAQAETARKYGVA
jgi:hypothetical protein